MRREKLIGTARRFVFPVLVLVLVGAFLLLCRGRVQTRFPELHPENGVMDARAADFGHNVYHLVNNWDYWPGALYTPEELSDPETAPAKDNDAPLDAVLGTWRLRLLARSNTYLTLGSFSIDYSTRIFVDGREVQNVGFVSDDPAQAVPKVRYVTLPLFTGEDGAVEIVYQSANYWHNDGGFIQSTVISTPENVDEYLRGLTLYSMLLSCGLLFLMFYFLLCASIQKRWEYAALALCCLVMALRNQWFFAEHLLRADYDFYLEYRILVLDVSWIPFTALTLLTAFYPKAVGKRSIGLLAAAFLILTVLHFLLPIRSLVLVCHICYYVCVPFLLWFIRRLVRWFRREQKSDGLDALTLTALALLTGTLIWEGMNTGSNSTVNHFGVTPLAMVICTLLLAVVINGRIQRQTALLQEAEARNELLDQVNTMNKDFLRMVAHELKTPLTVISGYAQLLTRQMEKQQLSDQAPERLRTIRSEADRLSEMVSRLMDYTYGNASEADMGAVDTDELLKGAAAVMTPICAKRQNALRLAEGFHGWLHGSYELLLQVLINLIVNASRHTSEGTITVRAEDAGSFAAFYVTDTGSGVAPEAVPHIFEKGYTTTEGKGLGLAICKETVELHGGTLELVSTGPEGSCFRFTVPKEGEA